jgi:hypothetical protein
MFNHSRMNGASLTRLGMDGMVDSNRAYISTYIQRHVNRYTCNRRPPWTRHAAAPGTMNFAEIPVQPRPAQAETEPRPLGINLLYIDSLVPIYTNSGVTMYICPFSPHFSLRRDETCGDCGLTWMRRGSLLAPAAAQTVACGWPKVGRRTNGEACSPTHMQTSTHRRRCR